MLQLMSLQKRRDFLRLQHQGVKWVTSAFILQMGETVLKPEKHQTLLFSSLTAEGCVRIGYVVTKKRGSAVIRNRARRRLREIVRLIFPNRARENQDYVLIARQDALTRDFLELQQDLGWALSHVHRLFDQLPRKQPS